MKSYKDMTKEEREVADMEYFTKNLYRGVGLRMPTDYEVHKREDNERI